MDSSVPAIRCRQIGEADIAAVTALLARGFSNRTPQLWTDALEQLRRRDPPEGFPKYGYLLESGDVPVGALLLIWAWKSAGGFGPMLASPSQFRSTRDFLKFLIPALNGAVG